MLRLPWATHELSVLADRGHYSGRQILACQEKGAIAYVPKPLTSPTAAENRFGKQDVVYLPREDVDRCPAGELLSGRYDTVENDMTLRCDWTTVRPGCSLKTQCMTGRERRSERWEHEGVLDTMQKRLDQVLQAMLLRRRTAEHP